MNFTGVLFFHFLFIVSLSLLSVCNRLFQSHLCCSDSGFLVCSSRFGTVSTSSEQVEEMRNKQEQMESVCKELEVEQVAVGVRWHWLLD